MLLRCLCKSARLLQHRSRYVCSRWRLWKKRDQRRSSYLRPSRQEDQSTFRLLVKTPYFGWSLGPRKPLSDGCSSLSGSGPYCKTGDHPRARRQIPSMRWFPDGQTWLRICQTCLETPRPIKKGWLHHETKKKHYYHLLKTICSGSNNSWHPKENPEIPPSCIHKPTSRWRLYLTLPSYRGRLVSKQRPVQSMSRFPFQSFSSWICSNLRTHIGEALSQTQSSMRLFKRTTPASKCTCVSFEDLKLRKASLRGSPSKEVDTTTLKHRDSLSILGAWDLRCLMQTKS